MVSTSLQIITVRAKQFKITCIHNDLVNSSQIKSFEKKVSRWVSDSEYIPPNGKWAEILQYVQIYSNSSGKQQRASTYSY